MARPHLRQRFTRLFLSFRGVAVVSALAIVVLVAACVSVLIESRNELVRRADMMAMNIGLLADETVRIEVGRYDTRMLDIIADLHAGPWTKQTGIPRGDDLFGGEAQRDSIGDIIIIGADGAILSSSRPAMTPTYLRVLRTVLAQPARGPNGLSVTTVLLGPGIRPQLALTRQCLAGACGPASAVVAILPLAWIQGVFGSLNLGQHGAIALLDSGGSLLVRQPAATQGSRRTTLTPARIRRTPRNGFFTYQNVSPTDGLHRRVTVSWVGALPLLILVGISKADILRGWNVLAVVMIAAVILLSGALVALTFLLAREVHRKTLVDRQLLSLNKQLAEQARTDPLTGLLNRRGFDENLGREWRRCRRAAKPLSLLMIDADHFKYYNDTFGHQAGDAILRVIADCVVGKIRRPGDIAARYGGEEFSVVLPDTDFAVACTIADGIRAGIEALAIPHGVEGGLVTISVGVSSTAPTALGTAEDLVAAADGALYESKALGRNRVTGRRITPQPSAAAVPVEQAPGYPAPD